MAITNVAFRMWESITGTPDIEIHVNIIDSFDLHIPRRTFVSIVKKGGKESIYLSNSSFCQVIHKK